MTLFQEIKAAGIPYSNHYSDLYLPNTEQVIQILENRQIHSTVFFNRIEGGFWRDIPFMYDPFWEARRLDREKELKDPNSMVV